MMKMTRFRKLISIVISLGVFSSLIASPGFAATKKKTDLQILGSQIAVNARKDFLLQIKNAPNRTPNLEFHIDPTMNPNLLLGIKVDTALSANFWSSLRTIDQKVLVYVAPTENFQFFIDELKPTLTPQGLFGDWLGLKLAQAKEHPHGFYGGGAPAFDKNDNPVFIVYAPNEQDLGSGFWTQSTSHEFVHVIQRYLMGGNMSPMLGWVIEGQADYIGANFGTRNSTEAFASYWAQLIGTIPENSKFPEIINWNKQQFINWFKEKEITLDPQKAGDIPVENYVLGAMASQYLYGTYGYKKVNAYYNNLSQVVPDCQNGDSTIHLQCNPSRQKAFKDAFGISMADFYPKVSAFIVSEIAWSKIAATQYPKDLLKIAPSPWVGSKMPGTYVAPPNLGPISKYAHPEESYSPKGSQSNGGSGNQMVDPYPPNIAAPGRSCPDINSVATLYGASMTCVGVGAAGVWTLDPGQVVGPATTK
jgi:hypothetical protein